MELCHKYNKKFRDGEAFATKEEEKYHIENIDSFRERLRNNRVKIESKENDNNYRFSSLLNKVKKLYNGG